MSDERFVHAWLLGLDPAWRRRTAAERDGEVAAFCAAADRSAARLMQHAYSTIGLRAEGDLLLWRMSERIEEIEETAADLLASCSPTPSASTTRSSSWPMRPMTSSPSRTWSASFARRRAAAQRCAIRRS